MHFLFDGIDLKQSVEGTRKVLGKHLKTVLDEVYFIVNLYNFPLSPFPQANPSFFKVSHLPPSQAKQLPKFPPLDTSTIVLVCVFSSNLSHS